jgi:hypothetical protein
MATLAEEAPTATLEVAAATEVEVEVVTAVGVTSAAVLEVTVCPT